MADAWFKPKSYGYGVSPANWKGWVATLGFAALSSGAGFVVLPMKPASPSLSQWGVWAIVQVGLAICFILLARVNTDGVWRWRSGIDVVAEKGRDQQS